MIYLDNHATTPCDRRIARLIHRCLLDVCGNANSLHGNGEKARELIDKASLQVASLVGCQDQQVIFTSGATESLNMAIRGVLMAKKHRKPVRVALSPYEHSAVHETCLALRRRGYIDELTFIRGDNVGRVDLNHIQSLCRRGLDLLCVMAANNEIGTIQPIRDIARICNNHGVPYLCDATQAAGRIPLSVLADGINLLAISGHKLYGPQGVGALICNDCKIGPILYGGGIRPGTQNVAGIVGLGEACRLRSIEMGSDERRIMALRNRLQTYLSKAIAGISFNGCPTHRLAGNLHFSVPYLNAAQLLTNLGNDLACSTGSACAQGKPSRVLTALRLPPELIRGSIRIGIGKFNTEREIDYAGRLLASAIMNERIDSLSTDCGCF